MKIFLLSNSKLHHIEYFVDGFRANFQFLIVVYNGKKAFRASD